MAGEATTLPLPGAQAPAAQRSARRGQEGLTPPTRAVARANAGTWVAIGALSVIVLLSVVVVLMAAERPSGLTPTSQTNYFPAWMAGPLGGLWPGLTRSGTTLRYMFTAAVGVMFVSYLLVLRNVSRAPARLVIGAIVIVHAIFLLAPPMALTDVFNYINYGRMEIVHHLNPYTTIPIVEPHDDPSFVLSNWHELLSPYGPLFTMLTFAVVPLGVVASFWTLKALLMLASLATIVLVWRCARLLGRDPVSAVALVGLNPIVLIWGLGGDHNDFLMLLMIVLGFYLLLLGKARATASPRRAPRVREWLLPLSYTEIGAGAAFVTAVAFKASGAILIPIVLAGMLRWRRGLVQVLIGMVAAGALLGVASLVAFGLHIPDLSTQGRLVTSESVPNLVGLLVGAGGETATLRVLMSLALIAVVLLCCRMAYLREDAITACGWASVALLVTLSWVLPWYVLWVLPLAALSSSRRLRLATAVLGVYLIIAWAPAAGLFWNAIGFHPERTPLGRLHQRYVRELLN
ncbi:MAG TPA: hypothetical protein VKG82_01330 [Solirubrobacteraceae bacterium]|nr:hypothetical protein [Solirubrobacteraceae bacterium]